MNVQKKFLASEINHERSFGNPTIYVASHPSHFKGPSHWIPPLDIYIYIYIYIYIHIVSIQQQQQQQQQSLNPKIIWGRLDMNQYKKL